MNHKEIERWYRLKNIKRASQVLVLASVVLLVSGYAASRFLQGCPESFDSPPGGEKGIRIERFSYSSPGAHPWDLEAASALVSDSLDQVMLDQPKVVYYRGAGKIFLTADTGQLDRKSRNVVAKGNVTIQFNDLLFAADQIDYSHEKLIAKTSSKVSLDGGDLSVSGKGMKMSLENEEIVIEQDVKARLFNVKLTGTNPKLPM